MSDETASHQKSTILVRQVADSSTTSARKVPDSSITSARKLPDSSTTSVRIVPDSSTTSVRKVPDSSTTSARKMPDNSTTSVRKVPDSSTTSARIVPDSSTTSARKVPDSSTTSARKVPDSSTTSVRKVPDSSTTSVRIVPDSSTTSARKVPDSSTTSARKVPDSSTTSFMKVINSSVTLAVDEPASLLLLMPDPPERPLDSDCCGGGCVPCVMDIYREEMALWEADCQRLLAGTSHDDGILEQQEQMIHPTKYAHFPIEEISQEAVDSVRIRCILARHQTLGLSLGQHIIVRSQLTGSSITRQYTPISPLDAKGYFELLIKVYPVGRMSQRITAWKVGHQLEARGPAGQLAYVRNKFRRVLMLCAGTGVAPMCQVIQSVLADAEDETYLRLVYAGRSYHHLMVTSEIEEWRRFWNFSCRFVLSQEPSLPRYSYKRGENICLGHINKDLVLREMAGGDIGTTLVLVCGTRSFNKDMMTYLIDMGVPDTNIHQY